MSEWKAIAPLNEIPVLGSRVIETADAIKIAIFRTSNDDVFAIKDECPHQKGPLSQGIVHGTTVTCPLHNWKINLNTGEALAPDEGCTHRYDTKVEESVVYIKGV